MTPLAGFIIALASGLMVRPPRRAMAAATPPWLAVLTVQTWHLASGHGINPATTIRDPGYWVVQLIALVFMLGITAGISSWRARHVSDPLGSAMRTVHVVTLSAVATVVAAGISLPIVIFVSAGQGKGSGSAPVAGGIGMLACVVTLTVLGIVEIRRRRASRADRGAQVVPGNAR